MPRTGKKLKPEEAVKAVQLTRSLEVKPLGDEAKKARRWLSNWLHEVRELRVPRCSGLFQSSNKSKAKYGEELALQMEASLAAFAIEHPDLGVDPEERIKAAFAEC